MTRLKFTLTQAGALASVMIASVNIATAGEKGDAAPRRMVLDALEKLTGSPVSIVTPPVEPVDPYQVPPGWKGLSSLPVQKPEYKKTVLRNEWGGRLDMHRMRFASYNASGDDIEIRGICHSACTLVMGIIPRDRICFSAQGYLSFHKASNADGTMSWDHTVGMVSSYPLDIQRWIEKQGGIADMPHQGRWVLAAPDLWKMGYRKCPPVGAEGKD